MDGRGSGEFPDAVRGDREDGLWGACGGPDGFELGERLVEVDGHVGLVEERRNATDRPAQRLLDLVGLGHPDAVGIGVADLGQPVFADPVDTAGHDHHQLVGDHRDGTGDLCDVTADGRRRVLGRSGPFGELVYLDFETQLLACSLAELGRSSMHARGCDAR